MNAIYARRFVEAKGVSNYTLLKSIKRTKHIVMIQIWILMTTAVKIVRWFHRSKLVQGVKKLRLMFFLELLKSTCFKLEENKIYDNFKNDIMKFRQSVTLQNCERLWIIVYTSKIQNHWKVFINLLRIYCSVWRVDTPCTKNYPNQACKFTDPETSEKREKNI